MSQSVPRPVLAFLALGLTSFCFSSVVARYASDAPALTLLVWRTLLAVALLLPFLRRRHLEVYRRLGAGEIARILAAGVLLGIHFYFFFESLYHTTVASTTMLVSLSPLFMAGIGYVFLKERLAPAVWTGIVVATVGGILIAWGDATGSSAPNPGWGNLLAILAALTVSLYLILGRSVRQGMDWLTYVAPLYATSAATILVMALVMDVPLTGFPPRVYIISAVLAVGPQLIGHGAFNMAVRYLPAALLGLLSLTEPVGASLLALMLFDERPGAVSFLGMGIALVGVALALAPSLFQKVMGRKIAEPGAPA